MINAGALENVKNGLTLTQRIEQHGRSAKVHAECADSQQGGASKAIKEYNKVFTGNVIAHNRMDGVGVLSKEDAISYNCTGPSGRASGWSCDVRKTHPYGIYSELDFEEVVRTEGDSMARCCGQ